MNENNQTQSSFLFSTCDFMVNYRGCGSYVPTFLLINLIFLVVFSVLVCMTLVFVLERLYSYCLVKYEGRKAPPLWTFAFSQGVMTLVCFLVKIGGLATMRFVPQSETISNRELQDIVAITIMLEAIYEMLGNYTLFRYSRFVLTTLGRFQGGNTEISSKTTLIAYYQVTFQLASILSWVLWASVGLQNDLIVYTTWRSIMCGLGTIDYLVEPYFLWLFGSKIILSLKGELKKNQKNPKLQSKINRIQTTILSISLTSYLPFGYLACGLGNYLFQSNVLALVYLKAFTMCMQSLGGIAASIQFFKSALHNLQTTKSTGSKIVSSVKTVEKISNVGSIPRSAVFPKTELSK